MRRHVYVIDCSDAERYRKTLKTLRERLLSSSARDDGSFRRWADRHVVVIDEMLRAMGGRPR